MSQVVKRVCDLCGHEITENLDTGNINFNYANSMGYMCSHNIDICKECAPKIVPALHKTHHQFWKSPGRWNPDRRRYFFLFWSGH